MTEQTCELPESNPLEVEIKEILEKSKTIAIVGLSDKPERDSYRVAEYLKGHGYTIIPVNPTRSEILGEKSYPDLASIPVPVDIVDIFRNIDAIPAIVDEAIEIRAQNEPQTSYAASPILLVVGHGNIPGSGVAWVVASQCLKDQGCVLRSPGHWAQVVEGEHIRTYPHKAHPAVRRLEADNSTKGGGIPNGSSRI